MSYFTRYLQRLVKFWQRRKKCEVNFASKMREQSGFTVSKVIKNPMDYKCLLDESYKRVGSTFPAGIFLLKVNTTTS